MGWKQTINEDVPIYFRAIYGGLHRWARKRRRSKQKKEISWVGRRPVSRCLCRWEPIMLKFTFVSSSRAFTRIPFINARLLIEIRRIASCKFTMLLKIISRRKKTRKFIDQNYGLGVVLNLIKLAIGIVFFFISQRSSNLNQIIHLM